MRSRLAIGAAGLALLLALAGCAGTTGSAGTEPADDAASSASSAPSEDSAMSADAVLMTADSSLGEIVVDAAGRTVYMFDKDQQGTTTSACTGDCLAKWPPVTTDAASLTGDGVTGELGTITTPDGEKQLTLNGWPLYYFAADSAAGDVQGQGVNGVWWVLSPAGERMAS